MLGQQMKVEFNRTIYQIFKNLGIYGMRYI